MKVAQGLLEVHVYICGGRRRKGGRGRFVDLPTITQHRGRRSVNLFAKPYKALLE